jgi:hypothetical protein
VGAGEGGRATILLLDETINNDQSITPTIYITEYNVLSFDYYALGLRFILRHDTQHYDIQHHKEL